MLNTDYFYNRYLPKAVATTVFIYFSSQTFGVAISFLQCVQKSLLDQFTKLELSIQEKYQNSNFIYRLEPFCQVLEPGLTVRKGRILYQLYLPLG